MCKFSSKVEAAWPPHLFVLTYTYIYSAIGLDVLDLDRLFRKLLYVCVKAIKVLPRLHGWSAAGYTNIIWTSTRRNLSSRVCEQQRRRLACAYAHSVQRLCYSLIGKYSI